MTTDLWMLVWTAMLCLTLPVVYASGRLSSPGGLAYGMGNREGEPPPEPAWVKRGVRAHANLVENLAVFAILVLVAHLAGRANATTALGATLFFWARVAHAAVYVLGLTGIRTLAFFAGTVGELLILAQLF
ncbi:MAG: MAPEG family protein [bacterium]|nr:MAPEG family protein [bacterium]